MDDLTSLHNHILHTNQAYLNLTRHQMHAAEVLDHKLHMARWRDSTLNTLLALAESGIDFDPQQLVDSICALHICLPVSQQRRLEGLLPNRELVAQTLAGQGKRLADMAIDDSYAGPDVDLAINVNRTSKWSFEKWRSNPRFSEYQFDGDGVYYRGFHFRPGDIVLADVNLEGNFVYSMFPDPKGFCSHSGVIAILEYAGRRWPAVIETFEKGLRAVPLNIFLNERYISYGEVFRHQGIDDAQTARINHLAKDALDATVGYNFNTEDTDRRYLACTAIGRFLLQDVGLGEIRTISGIRQPGLLKNLARLGYTQGNTYFAPVDYLLLPEFRCVGWIDNHQFAWLLTRELVEARFRKMWEDGDLQMRRMPLMVHLNHFSIDQIRKRTLLGRLLGFILGFDHISLPKGPTRLLAAVEMIEEVAGHAVKKLLPFIRQRLNTQEFVDLTSWLNDPEVQRELRRHFNVRWLQPTHEPKTSQQEVNMH